MTPEQFSQIADIFADAAFLLDKDGSVQAANRATHTIGQSPAKVVGRPLYEFCSNTAEDLRHYLRLCSRSREPVPGAIEIVSADGENRLCRCYGAVVVPTNGEASQVMLRIVPRESSPTQFAALNQKIAELTEEIRRRMLAEERQREQSELLRVTLTSIGDAVITTDAAGRVTFLNTVAQDLTGWQLSDAQGHPLEQVFNIVNEHSRQNVENPVAKVLREGHVVALANHTLLIAKDGTERPIDDSAAPITNGYGQIEGVVLVFRDVTEQKAAQQVVRDPADRLTGILAASLDHIYVVGRDGRYRFVSAGGASVMGFQSQAMIGKHWRELGLPAESMKRFDAQREKVLQTGSPLVEEMLYRSSTGDERYFEYVVTPLPSEHAQSDAVVVVSRDITERRKAEAARRENENRLQLVLQAGQMGTWNWDIDSDTVRWSPQLEAIHGLAPGTFPGTFEAYQHDIHPEDRERVIASIEHSLRTGQDHHVEYRLVLPDGSMRWVEARGTIFRDESQNPSQMIGVCVETTQRKRIEHDLRFLAEASQSLASLVDYESTLQRIASLAVPHFADWCSVDLPQEDGKLRQLAVAHADPAKVELAHELRTRWPPDPEGSDGVYQVFRTGRSVLVEEISDAMLRRATEDDEHLNMVGTLGLKSYMCVPLAVRENTIGVISFVSAESGRRYTTADLALAEDLGRRAAIACENSRLYAKLREEGRKKDEFLAMLAHELRNPLAPIRSGLDLLGLMGIDSDILETMQRQVEHLVRLVDDLLDVSRIMRGKIELRRESVEVATVVQRAVDTVRPLTEKNRQQLGINIPPKPIWIDADGVRMAQVISNLLNNATKYTEPGGKIEISVEPRDQRVFIRVRDTGIGISPDILPQVFDLFTQDQRSIDRSQGGLGIGLTVVKSLVEMHGGTVSVQSEGPGKGSEFAIVLPTIAPAAKTNNVGQHPNSTAAMRILVVDDNVSAANMLSLLLEKLGDHQVFTAHDGIAALDAAKQYSPDLILLDIGLPKLDGLEVARQLRTHRQFDRVRLVALTGYGTEEDRRKSFDAGFDAHLVKPPGIEALQKLLPAAPADLPSLPPTDSDN
jgi:PAS domain S-box-containing protein